MRDHESRSLLPSKRRFDDLYSGAPPLSPPPLRMLRFFVRIGACSRVFSARPDEHVEDLHSRIRDATGIPVHEQRLIYAGRQLQSDRTLADCGVSQDSCLHLSGKLRSMQCPRAWTLANEVISWVSYLLEHREPPLDRPHAIFLIRTFLATASAGGEHEAAQFLKVFVKAGTPAALAMVYLSDTHEKVLRKSHVEDSILLFVNPGTEFIELHCVPVLLEFCRLLRGRVGRNDKLYTSLRRKLGLLLVPSGFLNDAGSGQHSLSVIKELLPLVVEIGIILRDMLREKQCGISFSTCRDVIKEFSSFLVPMVRAMVLYSKGDLFGFFISDNLRRLFHDLLNAVDSCLKMVEDEYLNKEGVDLSECQWTDWSCFVEVLSEMNGASVVVEGFMDSMHEVLVQRKVPFNALIGHLRRSANFRWMLQLDDVLDFEARRNLAMMLFPEEKEDYQEMHEMLIDRTNLLAESFEYIMNADPVSLQNNILMEFKNEDATGPGVLREWVYLLSQAIFSPQNVLFLPSLLDRRRFFPNPTSAVDPLHLKYFSFCGRIVALALRKKIPIGIVFDRLFYKQLAGKSLSLEDIKAADPVFYTSCQKILEMEAEILDSDSLGLTFASEVEEMGARRLVELCPGGKDMVVNSKNREEFIDLLIRHRYVTSISQQVSSFAQGFADIISGMDRQRMFFQSLKLEDFDRMLGGKDTDICIEDWKTHTEYRGYSKNDKHIKWFWKVVKELSSDRRRVLMTFWTSLRHLPSEGFRGLPSKLSVQKCTSTESLPTAHTCFYQLTLPAYPFLRVMRERLQLITQEHVGNSFGLW